MGRITILLMAFILAFSGGGPTSRQTDLGGLPSQNETPFSDPEHAIKVTLGTVDPNLGLPTERYKIGQEVLVAIRMTNTSGEPFYACVSSDLYQDLPTLTRDGKILPLMNWQASNVGNDQKDQSCQHENMPEPLLLEPQQPTLADWLVVVDDNSLPTGAMPWYDPLPPGRYELSIQRHLGCCDGPMLKSNEISFDIVP